MENWADFYHSADMSGEELARRCSSIEGKKEYDEYRLWLAAEERGKREAIRERAPRIWSRAEYITYAANLTAYTDQLPAALSRVSDCRDTASARPVRRVGIASAPLSADDYGLKARQGLCGVARAEAEASFETVPFPCKSR